MDISNEYTRPVRVLKEHMNCSGSCISPCIKLRIGIDFDSAYSKPTSDTPSMIPPNVVSGSVPTTT